MNTLSKFATATALLVGLAAVTPAAAQSGYVIKKLRQDAKRAAERAAALVEAGKESRAAAVELKKDEHPEAAEAEFATALMKFAEARRLDPANVTALLEAAWVHNEIKEFGTAAAEAEAALALDPDNAEGWRELGYAHWKQDDLPRAERELRRAIKINRTGVDAYTYLIGVLEEAGDDEAADGVRLRKELVEQAIEVNPFNPPVETVDDEDD